MFNVVRESATISEDVVETCYELMRQGKGDGDTCMRESSIIHGACPDEVYSMRWRLLTPIEEGDDEVVHAVEMCQQLDLSEYHQDLADIDISKVVHKQETIALWELLCVKTEAEIANLLDLHSLMDLHTQTLIKQRSSCLALTVLCGGVYWLDIKCEPEEMWEAMKELHFSSN